MHTLGRESGNALRASHTSSEPKRIRIVNKSRQMTTKNFHKRKLSKGPNNPKMDPLSLTTKVKIHDDGLDQSDLVN